MPQYVLLKTENDFCNSIIEPNHALLFSESTENGIVIKAKISDGTFTNIVDPRANGLKAGFETLTGESLASIAAGITSLNNSKTAIRNAIAAKGQTCTTSTPLADYAGLISNISGGGNIYKCASVGNGTWTGYLYDQTTQSIASTATSLTYSSSVAPTVGKYYSEDGMLEIKPYSQNGLVLYAPLRSSQSVSETGDTLTVWSGSPSYTTVDGINCCVFSSNTRIKDSTNTATQLITTTSATWSIFIKADSSQSGQVDNQSIIFGMINSGGMGLLLNGNDRIAFQCKFSSWAVTANQTITTQEWHHVCGIVDGTSVKLYLDGVLVQQTTGSGSYTPPIDSNGTFACVGGIAYIDQYNPDIGYFDGYAAEAKLWNRALTQAEVVAEYNRLHVMVTA